MEVDVRLFAILRERAGTGTLRLELTEGATVADALAAAARAPGLGETLSRMPVRAALNREYVADDAPIAPGDELALIPPVSGGATAAARARITDRPLSIPDLAAAVTRPGAGAIVVFCGITREVERLEYEAYAEMAGERIERILDDCLAAHDLEAAAAEHRVGSVPLGEPSVVVAVSAAHRGEAFAGAREAIDRIKAEAPIFKREVEGDRGRWVDGTPPPGAESAAARSAESAPGPSAESGGRLTHLDDAGSARMVDVGAKAPTERVAVAEARVRMSPDAAAAVEAG
ncbi:MAG: hypothetical protein GEU88_10070, partial [Solirubrobacterales bacterium]|nr:hypothetical protein [Solirubrobacterales bacterium]